VGYIYNIFDYYSFVNHLKNSFSHCRLFISTSNAFSK